MPIEPPTGFLTRPEASRLYNRSQRALERDLNVAIGTGNDDVLPHFLLQTKDGQIRQATDVSVEQVKAFVAEGMSPVWHVEEAWLLDTYGRKGEPKPRSQTRGQQEQDQTASASSKHSNSGQKDNDLPAGTDGEGTGAVYRQRFEQQTEEIRYLRNDLEIKNEQIKEANSRTRESNLLMQELQKMLGSWQERAFQSLPVNAENSIVGPDQQTPPNPVVAVTNPPAQKQKSTTAQTTASTQNRQKSVQSKKKPATKRRKNQASKKMSSTRPTSAKYRWYETPTLNRILSRD